MLKTEKITSNDVDRFLELWAKAQEFDECDKWMPIRGHIRQVLISNGIHIDYRIYELARKTAKRIRLIQRALENSKTLKPLKLKGLFFLK